MDPRAVLTLWKREKYLPLPGKETSIFHFKDRGLIWFNNVDWIHLVQKDMV
jgi:hypothetical protein